MFMMYVFQFILILSLSGISYASRVHAEDITEPQAIVACIEAQWNECKLELEKSLSKNSAAYKQLQYVNDFPVEAARFGCTELVQVLLNSGVNCSNNYGNNNETLLHEAATYGHNDLVTILLSQTAYINVQDKFGNTPLHRSITFYKPATVKLLLEKGAAVDISNSIGKNPFHEAASYDDNSCGTKILTFLVEHGADINAADNLGQTPLHCAVMRNNVWAVKFLVNNDCNTQIKDYLGETALDIAKKREFTEIVNILSKTIKHAY